MILVVLDLEPWNYFLRSDSDSILGILESSLGRSYNIFCSAGQDPETNAKSGGKKYMLKKIYFWKNRCKSLKIPIFFRACGANWSHFEIPKGNIEMLAEHVQSSNLRILLPAGDRSWSREDEETSVALEFRICVGAKINRKTLRN